MSRLSLTRKKLIAEAHGTSSVDALTAQIEEDAQMAAALQVDEDAQVAEEAEAFAAKLDDCDMTDPGEEADAIANAVADGNATPIRNDIAGEPADNGGSQSSQQRGEVRKKFRVLDPKSFKAMEDFAN